MAEMETVVSAVGLNKVFRDFWNRPKARAVNDIDFEIRQGKWWDCSVPTVPENRLR